MVIMMGRKRTWQAFVMASRSGLPRRRNSRVNSTIRMESDTTMPIIIITPISDMTLTVVCVISRNRITPVKPGGMASRMMKGSLNEANCAIRIR